MRPPRTARIPGAIEDEDEEYADDNESFADVDDLEGKPYHSTI